MATKEGAVDSPGKINVAILGCGVIARRHLQRMVNDQRWHIAALCDIRRDSAQALANTFSLSAPLFTDFAQALRAPGLQAVVVCSPTLDHHRHSALALDLGLHVLCEKPLCAARTEIEDLIARQKKVGRILLVAYQRRYEAAYATARRELTKTSDRYGRVRQIHVFVCERWQPTMLGTWRDDPAIGAGYFGDACSHQIDVLQYITGARPLSVLAQSDKRQAKVEIVTQVWSRWTQGISLAAHFVGDAHHFREDIHLHCEKADLLLRQEQLFCAHENRVEAITDLENESDPIRAFGDAILKGEAHASGPECALPMHDWTQAVVESIQTGKWVDLPN